MIEADHRIANDFSRKYWVVLERRTSVSSSRSDIRNETASELRSGEAQYVIIERRIESNMNGKIRKYIDDCFSLEAWV